MQIVKLQKQRIIKDLNLEEKKAVLILGKGDNSSFLEVVCLDFYGELNYSTMVAKNNNISNEIKKLKEIHKNISEIIESNCNKLPSRLIANALSKRVVMPFYDNVQIKGDKGIV